MPQNRQNKEYYAIFQGRVKEPTIFSSCRPESKSCYTLQEARAYSMGANKVKEVIKSGAGETTPLGGNGFYAVANGKAPGIYRFYYGENGAEKEVTEEGVHAINDLERWPKRKLSLKIGKNHTLKFGCELIKDALDRGYRPRDIDAFRRREMGLIIDQFLCEPRKYSEVDGEDQD